MRCSSGAAVGCYGRLPQEGWVEEEGVLADREAVAELHLQQETGTRAKRKQERVLS